MGEFLHKTKWGSRPNRLCKYNWLRDQVFWWRNEIFIGTQIHFLDLISEIIAWNGVAMINYALLSYRDTLSSCTTVGVVILTGSKEELMRSSFARSWVILVFWNIRSTRFIIILSCRLSLSTAYCTTFQLIFNSCRFLRMNLMFLIPSFLRNVWINCQPGGTALANQSICVT